MKKLSQETINYMVKELNKKAKDYKINTNFVDLLMGCKSKKEKENE